MGSKPWETSLRPKRWERSLRPLPREWWGGSRVGGGRGDRGGGYLKKREHAPFAEHILVVFPFPKERVLFLVFTLKFGIRDEVRITTVYASPIVRRRVP